MSGDLEFMRQALRQAELAAALGEVPVGAVVVLAGEIVAAACNSPIRDHDPSAHAEIRALRAAGAACGNYRLPGAALFVTLEPCQMCAGAIIHARIARLVYGATDPRTGAAGSAIDIFAAAHNNHRPQVSGGLLGEESAQLLRRFFAQRRRSPGADGDDDVNCA